MPQLVVPPCIACDGAIDFEDGDDWIWFHGQEDPAHAVCRTCLTNATRSRAIRQRSAGWRDGDLAHGHFLFELRQTEPVPMGLGHIVLAAADEHAALLTALGQCRDTSDVRQWLVPDYVFTYALGPVFSSALADVNCLGGIVCKVYANNKGEMPR